MKGKMNVTNPQHQMYMVKNESVSTGEKQILRISSIEGLGEEVAEV